MNMTFRDFFPKPRLLPTAIIILSVPLMIDHDWTGIWMGMSVGFMFLMMTMDGGLKRDCAVSFLWAVLLATLLRTFVCQVFFIPSCSMQPTLQPGDCVFTTNLDLGVKDPFDGKRALLRTGDPRRFDVVVFTHPETGEAYIKRVVGLPGERVRVKGTKVYVNGKSIYDPYGRYDRDKEHVDCGTVRLGPDEYFVLGDNRDDSYDSRWWGAVRRDAIYATARFVYWSEKSGKARAGVMMR